MTKRKQNIRTMMALDIHLLALPPAEALRILKEAPPLRPRHPLIGTVPLMQRIAPKVKATSDADHIRRLQRKHGWTIDVSALLDRPYDALVLTDAEHRIEWVSSGFRRMTGHTAQTVIGRTPAFLQGPGTAAAALAEMREHLDTGRPVTAELINYRKNGTTYLCAVDITPLRTAAGHITHFIARENERP